MLMDEIKKRAEKPMQPEPSLEESFVEPTLKSEPVKPVLDFNGKRVRRAEAEPLKTKLKIEKMERCLHGRSCRNLISEPPASPMCDAAGLPVFDLNECPLMMWAEKQLKLIKG